MKNIKNQFPILKQKINNHPLIYFDNAATTQKPQSVIKKIVDFYQNINANPDRGWHTLGNQTAEIIKNTREKVKQFINAKSSKEIIFTSGTTMGLNMAAILLKKYLNKDDTILISEMEHHSNILPWQHICNEVGCKLKFIPITANFDLDIERLDNLLKKLRPKIVSLTQMSNVLGSITPIKTIAKKIHEINGIFIVDGAQGISHHKIDIQDLNCDVYAFSAHKMYGPTGIGVLYIKETLLNKLDPFILGGGIVTFVSKETTKFKSYPTKFETGTQNLSAIAGLEACIDFVNKYKIEEIEKHIKSLSKYLIEQITKIEQIQTYCKIEENPGIISFIVKNTNNLDIGLFLDSKGIIVRTGHHCAQILIDTLKINGTIRVSLGVYNTKKEIDFFIHSLKSIIKKF